MIIKISLQLILSYDSPLRKYHKHLLLLEQVYLTELCVNFRIQFKHRIQYYYFLLYALFYPSYVQY